MTENKDKPKATEQVQPLTFTLGDLLKDVIKKEDKSK